VIGKSSQRTLLLVFAICSLFGCLTAPTKKPEPGWAEPLVANGLPNLHRVNSILYRSAEPLPGAAESIKRLGIKTVIDLRVWNGDESLLGGQGLLNEKIPVYAWNILDRDVVAVLRLLAREENGPFLLHCEYGADRTGLMVAMYRILFQGRSREEAIEEMVYGGYGFHIIWQNIIHYVRSADLEALRAKIGKPLLRNNTP
jgi:protein tyrosine/serine phosphatase